MEDNSSNRFNLENHKKKDLFTVPDQYFEELPLKIQSRINQSKSRRWYEELAFNPLLRNASVGFGILLIVVGVVVFEQRPLTSPTENLSLAPLSSDEVMEYLLNNPYAALQLEELYESEAHSVGYSEDEVAEQADAQEIEQIVTDL